MDRIEDNKKQDQGFADMESEHTGKTVIKAVVVIILLAGLFVISRYNYPLFHSLVDVLTIFIAGSVFVVVWNRRHLLESQYYLFIGITFLFFAFFDFLHLLGNSGMGVFPEYGNLGPVLYICSRYILGVSLLVAPWFIKRKFNAAVMLGAYSIVSVLLVLSIFYWRNFPVAYIEGVGLTSFKVISDYVICGIIAVAVGLHFINRKAFDPRVFRLMVSSFILFIATGLAFTLYADPFGVTNAVGHFIQIASFYLVYRTFIETLLVKPQDILYRNLKQSQEEVLKLNAELERDINERKKVEEVLHQRTIALEAANKELEAFSYSVSHDLRAPLRAMDGFSEAVLSDYGEKLDETGRGYLDRVKKASRTMSQLIDDILKLSRISRAEMRQENVDLSMLVNNITNELKASDPERQSEVIIAPGITGKGDKNLLQIALRNLLENAWKYTGKCQTARIEFGVMELGNETVYYVRDNGVGFDMKYRDKLFLPFQRLHSNKEYPGTGIGLATVQRIIRKHNGRIWFESETGKGSTFYFTLE